MNENGSTRTAFGFDLGPCCIWQQCRVAQGKVVAATVISALPNRVLPSSSGALLELRGLGTAPFHIGNQGPIRLLT